MDFGTMVGAVILGDLGTVVCLVALLWIWEKFFG